MSFAASIAAVQAGGNQSQTSNSPIAGYLALALVAVAAGLIVLIFIRTAMGRSKR